MSTDSKKTLEPLWWENQQERRRQRAKKEGYGAVSFPIGQLVERLKSGPVPIGEAVEDGMASPLFASQDQDEITASRERLGVAHPNNPHPEQNTLSENLVACFPDLECLTASEGLLQENLRELEYFTKEVLGLPVSDAHLVGQILLEASWIDAKTRRPYLAVSTRKRRANDLRQERELIRIPRQRSQSHSPRPPITYVPLDLKISDGDAMGPSLADRLSDPIAESGEALAARQELFARLERSALSTQVKELLMFCASGMSFSEAARKLGLPLKEQAKIRKRLERLRKKNS